MKIWSDKLHACNKQIHQDILNFCCFQLKYEPLIFNNTSFSVKVHPLLSSHIKIHQHIRRELF